MDKELIDLLAHEEGTEVKEEPQEEKIDETREEVEVKAEEKEEAPPAAEEKVEESVEDEVRLTRTEYAKLMSQISELSSKIKPEAKEVVTEKPEPEKDIDFIGQEKLDDILSSRESVNVLLNKIHRAAVERGTTLAREQILRSLPEVVKASVSRFTALREMVSDFYTENPDLKSHKQFVGLVANEVASNNPDKINQPGGVKWIFKEAAKEARTRLKLKPVKESTPKTEPAKTLPGGTKGSGRGAQPAPAKKGLAVEIDEMLSTMQ